MTAEPPRYLAYLLRLWRTGSEGEPAWRASLESASSGERRGFSSLEALLAFLEEQMRYQLNNPGESPGETEGVADFALRR